MSTIKNIGDFYKLVSSIDFATTLADICKSAGDYSYQGFKPKSISDNEFISDISRLFTSPC